MSTIERRETERVCPGISWEFLQALGKATGRREIQQNLSKHGDCLLSLSQPSGLP